VICVYDWQSEPDFNTLGSAVLIPTSCRTRQTAGGGYTLDMQHPMDTEGRWRFLVPGNIVKVPVPEENRAVVKRVIHATADFDYAENLAFSEGAVEVGLAALRAGCRIVTDTQMARSGISSPALARLGCETHCFVADPEVVTSARAAGTTRAVMAMRVALERHPHAVIAVGNAPTALFALADRMREGARPALVIAAPVGFVNVVEAKEEMLATCTELDIPAIIARGRKGGSTVATAIVNALLYEAMGVTDPHVRVGSSYLPPCPTIRPGSEKQ
jgi:precorrin-8X/cobalt-precorrin-8 methylmutase